MKKTYFCRACLLALLLALLPSVANAAVGDSFLVDGIQYEVSKEGSTGNEVKVVANANGYTEANYTIPSTVISPGNTTYTVTSIGMKAFYQRTNLRTITLPDTLTKIYYSAFEDCDALQTVTLRADPTKDFGIYADAFKGCDTLDSVTLPAKVAISGGVFDYCPALSSVIYTGNKTTATALSDVYRYANDALVSYYPAGNATWTNPADPDITGTSPNRQWRDRKLQAHTPALTATPTSFPAGNAGQDCTVTIENSLFADFNATNCFASATLGGRDLDLGTVNGPAGSDGAVANGSIVITLREACLNTLAPGAHPLAVTLKGTDYDGVILSTTLTVTPQSIQGPAAGGSSASMAISAYAFEAYGGSWNGNVLSVSVDYARFISVSVDGIQLTVGRDCTVTSGSGSGSTAVTFMPAYLDALNDGTHTLRVQFTDGRYDGTFTTPLTIAAAAVAVPTVPATGHNALPGLWTGLALMTAAVCTAGAVRKRGR